MLISRTSRAIGPCLLLHRDRRLTPALVGCGANELDQCSHRVNPPETRSSWSTPAASAWRHV